MGLFTYPSLQAHVEIYLFARHHVICKKQYKDVLTMIPPFKENITLCYLVNDIEIEIDFVFVVLGLNETWMPRR